MNINSFLLCTTTYSELEAALKSLDTDGTGYLTTEQVLHGCHLLDIPVSDQLIEGSMEKFVHSSL